MCAAAVSALFAEGADTRSLAGKQVTSLNLAAQLESITDKMGNNLTTGSIGFALDMLMTPQESSFIGMNLNAGIQFPQMINYRPDGYPESISINKSLFSYFYLINMNLGMLFFPVRKKNVYFGIGPALCITGDFESANNLASMVMRIGAGSDLDCCIRISGNTILSVGMIAAVNVYTIDLADSRNNSAIGSASVTPHIGIGYSL